MSIYSLLPVLYKNRSMNVSIGNTGTMIWTINEQHLKESRVSLYQIDVKEKETHLSTWQLIKGK